MATRVRTAVRAIADHYFLSVADIKECRYHNGFTEPLEIYAFAYRFVTAQKTTPNPLPKTLNDQYNYPWKMIAKDFKGWDIYEYSPQNIELCDIIDF